MFLRAFVVGLALTTVASFLHAYVWWLDIIADFKVQYVFAAALLFGAAMAMRYKMEAILALLITNGSPLYFHLAIPD